MRVKIVVQERAMGFEEEINDAVAEIEKTGYVLDIRMLPEEARRTAMILYEDRPDEAAGV